MLQSCGERPSTVSNLKARNLNVT